jgi:hypothetical protein
MSGGGHEPDSLRPCRVEGECSQLVCVGAQVVEIDACWYRHALAADHGALQKVLRPAALAAYNASSARRNSALPSLSVILPTAIPMLVLT